MLEERFPEAGARDPVDDNGKAIVLPQSTAEPARV
jgi:hypothetical protein